jgi:hypothetical protein
VIRRFLDRALDTALEVTRLGPLLRTPAEGADTADGPALWTWCAARTGVGN